MFGHGKCSNLLSGDEAGQEALFLLWRAIEAELVDAKLGMSSV